MLKALKCSQGDTEMLKIRKIMGKSRIIFKFSDLFTNQPMTQQQRYKRTDFYHIKCSRTQ